VEFHVLSSLARHEAPHGVDVELPGTTLTALPDDRKVRIPRDPAIDSAAIDAKRDREALFAD